MHGRILKAHCLGNLTFQILLKSSSDRIFKAVRVPLALLMVDGEVLGHGIASVPVDNGGLVPVILGQDILGAADLAHNVVLCRVPNLVWLVPSRPDLQARHFGKIHPVKSRRTKLSFIFLPDISLTSKDIPSSAVFLFTMLWIIFLSSELRVAGTNITAS